MIPTIWVMAAKEPKNAIMLTWAALMPYPFGAWLARDIVKDIHKKHNEELYGHDPDLLAAMNKHSFEIIDAHYDTSTK